MDRSQTFPKAMNDVFCNTSMMQNTVYMARGIYEDKGVDQNHTFCVIGHERARDFHFSVVECVDAVLILNHKNDDECRHTEHEFAKKYGNVTKMHVTNKAQAAKRYKHILWVGPYMVFECIAATDTKAAYISYGAGSYFTYTGKCCNCSEWDSVFVCILTPGCANSRFPVSNVAF